MAITVTKITLFLPITCQSFCLPCQEYQSRARTTATNNDNNFIPVMLNVTAVCISACSMRTTGPLVNPSSRNLMNSAHFTLRITHIIILRSQVPYFHSSSLPQSLQSLTQSHLRYALLYSTPLYSAQFLLLDRTFHLLAAFT